MSGANVKRYMSKNCLPRYLYCENYSVTTSNGIDHALVPLSTLNSIFYFTVCPQQMSMRSGRPRAPQFMFP